MYSEDNLAERLTTYGLSDKLSYTLGPNAVTEAAKPDRRYFETTNKAMYEDKPISDKTAHPERFQNEVPSKFGKTDFCMKQLTGEPSDQPPSAAGGKGNRGEITRRPGESGNPYGVSVFVDEYATWGTAIKGMPLTETVDRKQTKYFPK
ncbi:hypothetical protein HYH03_001403 [Edaphochlamys debaryana]|uniref:Uncharacterized protein n=1 Tax=Edaphochlamys debaryana TaxID=47281 RepID=A0A836C4X5_9CHLO|nr:hypothetical protein HYH03_001403 [Edaphochlamys debaryana]|eukprot:KAG2500636.1 hypothetical protein HYH03_001403 [Edaphochlamys debaryana]